MSEQQHDPADLRTSIKVTPEFFDWLLAELERPPRVNPKMVELLRRSRGVVRHEER